MPASDLQQQLEALHQHLAQDTPLSEEERASLYLLTQEIEVQLARQAAAAPDAEFNAEFASRPEPTWIPAFEFDFVLDGELPPGYDPGPAPDFAPPSLPAPPPASKSFRAPPWDAPSPE